MVRDALEDTTHTLAKCMYITAKFISWELKHKTIKVENISYMQELNQGRDGSVSTVNKNSTACMKTAI